MADKQDEKPQQTPEEASGLTDGQILTDSEGNAEKVIFDYDADKNYVGWHKEPVKG